MHSDTPTKALRKAYLNGSETLPKVNSISHTTNEPFDW
tara:strand:- start:81 stop:194 length:114 start_codon:yes stop_codon:yes gene_type:complete